MSIIEATRGEVYKVPAVRWRRSKLAELGVAHVIPPTSGDHDVVSPFWEMGSEDPRSLAAIQGAHPREGEVCPFTPREIIGPAGEAGAGYVLHKIIPAASRTVQPGDVYEVEDRLTLEAWIHLPKTTAAALRGSYAGAYAEMWRGVRIPEEAFATYFSGVNPIFEIKQTDDILDPVDQGGDGAYSVTLQSIPLRRTAVRTGNPDVT